jgi:ubiquinone/menaquinone biosynthesis C-methylase UbiE
VGAIYHRVWLREQGSMFIAVCFSSATTPYDRAVTVTDTFESSDVVCDYLGIPWPAVREAFRTLHAASIALGDSPHADLLRMDACHRIRMAQDDIFNAPGDPVPAYAATLERVAQLLAAHHGLPLATSDVVRDSDGKTPQDVTANHYGALWGGFSPAHYFDEATELLRARFERNGIDLTKAGSQRALDAGCGGGRYSVALHRLGFKEVVGIDWSKQGIEVANARVAEAKISQVTYRNADVLKLPFGDNEFDFVFSNGVLHHTYNTQQGIDEMRRVLKPEGRAWLYLYHRPGGLDRLTHYIARLVLKHARHEVCRRYCSALGLAANRIFFLLDLWLTPIAEGYSPTEMDQMLGAAGFKQWRRAERGCDQDLVERMFQGEPFSSEKYGVGENRYLIES